MSPWESALRLEARAPKDDGVLLVVMLDVGLELGLELIKQAVQLVAGDVSPQSDPARSQLGLRATSAHCPSWRTPPFAITRTGASRATRSSGAV